MFLEHRKDIQILENNYYVFVCGFFLLIQQRNIHHGTIMKIKRYSWENTAENMNKLMFH